MAETELKLCVSSEEEEARKLENIRTTVEEHENSMKQKSETLKELEERIPVSETKVKAIRNELATIQTDLPQLMINIQRSRASVEDARLTMQASHSRNRIVEALMSEKNKGRCPGLFGRLVSKSKYVLYIKVR